MARLYRFIQAFRRILLTLLACVILFPCLLIVPFATMMIVVCLITFLSVKFPSVEGLIEGDWHLLLSSLSGLACTVYMVHLDQKKLHVTKRVIKFLGLNSNKDRAQERSGN